MRRYKALALFSLLSGASSPALSIAATCDGLLPNAAATAGHQDVTVRDLVRLRDIGPTMSHDTEAAILSVSPDGKQIAFQMRQADPEANHYCLGMVVIPTTPGGLPILVDQGGEFILENRAQDGFARSEPSGAALVITPEWSPDGQWIAYLRRDNGFTQLWKAKADGTKSLAVTQAPFDIETFQWSADGRSFVVTGRPSILTAKAAITKEASIGYLYDDRYVPIADNRPRPRGDFPLERFSIDADGTTGAGMKPLLPDEGVAAANVPPNASRLVRSKGTSAWVTPIDPTNVNSDLEIRVRFAGQQERHLALPHLQRVGGLWLSPSGRSLWIMRTDGWGYGWHASEQSLYRWDRAAATPVRVFKTDDVLIGCQMASDALICGQESSVSPRRIVRLQLATGAVDTLFDANPEFEGLRRGAVQRLKWTNSLGFQAFGDLVLPPDHRPGQKHPLVVVQYFSRGFLRGGTGDEYPVFALASKGFAVLSFEMPPNYSALQPAPVKTYDELNRIDFEGWANRKHILSALEAGIGAAIATGVVDEHKIGLTGLSDGASTAMYALFNGHIRYSAMAFSTCCGGSTVSGMLDGPVLAQYYQAMGYPKLSDPGTDFWNVFSIKANAARMDTPLLIQVPDDEYLGALDGFTALKEQGKPAEMYVYADEYHMKWQPAHRLANYTRAVDWFSFWLKGQEESDPGKVPEYQRWRAMREAQPKNMTVSPGA